MESQRGNIVCTVLFLDIIAYSRVSVSEQYDLKKSFNALISEKLLRVPESARISLDTGDGAAICFMGDPEDVLHTAIDIRRSLTDHEELNVRMGLHIGPVRILTDLNQRGNVVGDGINVAQRVMSFSDERTLLVSRAFYDVVSCLADRGADGFRYVGDQADKHGRIHQLYEVVVDDGASRIFHSIGESVGLTEVAGEELDERSVTLIEQELTNHLGPLAPVLIRKALKRASTPSQLRELLAPSIADPGLQEAFRLGTDGRHRDPSRTRSAGATRLTDHPPTSHTRSAPGSHTSLAGHSRPSQGSASLPLSNTGPSFRPTLPQEALEPLEKLLAKLVGPLARVLVKNEARKAADFGGLVQALSTHIDNAQARSQFLASATALRKSLRIGESRDSEMSVPSRGPRGTSRLADSTTRRTLSDLDASRFLSTVMFTDICDSTLHASHLGDRRWSEVLAKHHALVRAELSKLGGREMDTAGDGFFAIFDVPARAIRCACAIRDAVQTLGIDIRIGLHTGELETIGEKATGIAVHMGARIAALAEANQVLVSSTVKDLITGSSIRLIDRGTHQLKGIPGMWHLYAVQ
jgi:class 3 adenylate cyclase